MNRRDWTNKWIKFLKIFNLQYNNQLEKIFNLKLKKKDF